MHIFQERTERVRENRFMLLGEMRSCENASGILEKIREDTGPMTGKRERYYLEQEGEKRNATGAT